MKRLTMPVMAFSLFALGLAQTGHTQTTSGVGALCATSRRDRPQTIEITPD
jgi:hypothetical protein